MFHNVLYVIWLSSLITNNQVALKSFCFILAMNIALVTESQRPFTVRFIWSVFSVRGLCLMQKTPANWLITRDLKNKAMHTNQNQLVMQENAQQVELTGGFDNFTDYRIWASCTPTTLQSNHIHDICILKLKKKKKSKWVWSQSKLEI